MSSSSSILAAALRNGRLRKPFPSSIAHSLQASSRAAADASHIVNASMRPISSVTSLQSPLNSTLAAASNSNAHQKIRHQDSNHLSLILASATLLSAAVTSNSTATHCEPNDKPNGDVAISPKNTTFGFADEQEDSGSNGGNAIVADGMDAGSETPTLGREDSSSGLADEEEDEGCEQNDNRNYEEDDDDDPSKDEETTCSICLINRQGPCRKHWLKFERCMKEHSAEKEKAEKAREAANMEAANESVDNATEKGQVSDNESSADGEKPNEASLEADWDAFMEKSTQPGEEDEEEEDDDDDDDEDEDDEDESDDEDSDGTEDAFDAPEELSLAQRCDKFMIPWIGCIQEHRNIYSLISNAFYQKDFVDPLEDTVLESRKHPFAPIDDKSHQNDNEYTIQFDGVDVDLESWREHVEADADEGGEEGADEEQSSPSPASNDVEPRLINAYAKFRLVDPVSGQRIEVAYIKDQKGRLLGFDSFSKKEEHEGDDGLHGSVDGEEKPPAHHGECTFHIVPGETTSITAYAIYRGVEKEGANGEKVRLDDLYYTPEIPLPGSENAKN